MKNFFKYQKMNLYRMPLFGCGLLICLLFIIAERTWNHIYAEDPFIGNVLKSAQASPEVILVGDSVCVTKFSQDKDKRTLDQILANDLGKSVLNASRSGITLIAQKQLIELMLALNIRTECLFLEVNPLQSMRGLNIQAFNEWKLHLKLIQTPMRPEKRFFEYALYLDRKLSGRLNISHIDPLGVHEGRNDSVESFEKFLLDVISLSYQLSKRVICFIPPMDMPRVEKRFGEEEIVYLNKVRLKAAEICENQGVFFIDLHDRLKDKAYFPDTGYTDYYWVHLSDQGRHVLSQELVNQWRYYLK